MFNKLASFNEPQVNYTYGHLGVRYLRLNDNNGALECFRKMCELAVKFDSMDRITTMHSIMFEGKKFDKHTLGSTFSAKEQVKNLLTKKYPLTEEFRASKEFCEIILSLG